MKPTLCRIRSSFVLVLFAVLIIGCATATSPAPVPCPEVVLPGQAIPEALFELKDMDMHLHAGMERPIPMHEWIDLAVADGRKVIVLLDHLELYRETPEDYAAWAKERGFPEWYTVGKEGHEALMKDLASVNGRADVITFRGWEIYEGELSSGVEAEPMRLAEVIGWHISPHHGGRAPDGWLLIKRAKQIAELQKDFPIPMILFHPFSMRIENLQRTAKEQGKDVSSLTVDDYRFFQPGEQEELARFLEGKSIYIEISRGTRRCWTDPVVREALIADIKPLAEAGVQFTVSTDNHGVGSAKRPFEPKRYCDELGVTPHNTNTIVRELLALRARNSLRKAKDAAN